MCKRMLFFALCCVVPLISACATPLETVFVPTGKAGWKVGYAKDFNPGTILEVIPVEETIDNWSKMITIQFLEGDKSTPEETMLKLKMKMEERCKSTVWNVLAQTQYSVLYEWSIKSCGVNPDQHEIARLLKGNDGLHRIAYVEKVEKLSDATRDKWIKILSESYVEKGGEKVVIGPN